MRIRSIRPEFWTSEDIAALPWEVRLIYIGLWSYVDDNGVGRDVPKLIKAALFPLEDDPHGVLMQIAGALKQLETGGQITRYSVDRKPYLHISAWETHQKINRPTEGRYPLPTCGNAVIHDMLTEDSLNPPAIAPLGEGEKGRRGEEEKTSLSDAPASDLNRFDEFWNVYGYKIKRVDAEKAWAKAIRKTDPDLIIDKAGEYVARIRADKAARGERATAQAHAASWLNGERWDDEPDNVTPIRPATDDQGRTILPPLPPRDPWGGGA